MIYVLKLFDTPLIRFKLWHEKLRGAVCDILWTDEKKKAFFPIGLEISPEGLVAWLKSRTIPKNREYVEAVLASMNLQENDLIGILNICMGLSLNDAYWIVSEDFTGTFDDYNLYDNPFKKALSLIAYTGYGSVRAKGFTSSPEFTTNGMLRKGWRKLNGRILLYKGGTEGAANTGNEPFCEYYAYQIACAMGLNAIEYRLAKWKKSVCSVCELFTGKRISYVPIWRFGTFHNIVEISDFYRKLGKNYEEAFCDMMIFDALIYNTDRHQGNFGLLIDSLTNQPMAPAPIFDNGLGLFPYVYGSEIENLSKYAATRVSAFEISFDEIAKEYITDRQRSQLRKLLNFRFSPDKNYNWPAKKVKHLEVFIQKRAGELLKF